MTRRTITRGLAVLRRAANAVFGRSARLHFRFSEMDTLEPRQMMAVFNGTEESDTIRITRVGSFTHVNINNVDNSTTDAAISIDALGGSDFVLMDYVHPDIVINLGSGNDRVSYGGPTRDIFGELAPALLVGGSGVDTVVFDDGGGPLGTPREYHFDGLNAMNQSLLAIENLELTVRDNALDAGNLVQFSSGFPVSQSILITDDQPFNPFGSNLFIGTESSPIDLDNYNVSFECQETGFDRVSVFNQNTDSSPNDFILFTTSSGARQHIQKGGFQFAHSDGFFGDITLHGGSTPDTFGIGGISTRMNVDVFGDAGNDSMFTTNFNGHDNDLDAISPHDQSVGSSGSCQFNGGDGLDFIDLDDSADVSTDGDDNYTFRRISPLSSNFRLSKTGSPGLSSVTPFSVDDSVEHINIVADAGASQISFETGPGQVVTLNGGGGNDVFAIRDDVALQDCRGVARIVGGAGVDSMSISDDDPAFQQITTYSFNSGGMLYGVASGSLGQINYDGSLESLTVVENANGATTSLNAKPAAMALSLDLGSGDDTLVAGNGDLDSSGLMSTAVTINANTGEDHITLDDRLDASTTGETESYTFSSFTIAKGSPAFTYSTFEHLTLLAADRVVSGQLTVTPIVNMNALNGFLDSTTINGGPNRGCIVNVGDAASNLNNISGVVNINDCTSLTIDDTTNTTINSTYLIASTFVRKSSSNQTINYTNVPTIVLNASNQGNSIAVSSVPAGTAVTVNANGGSDGIALGGGDISSNILGLVTINGGTGSNAMVLNNALDSAFALQTLTASAFTDGLTHPYSAITSLTVNQGPGGGNLVIDSVGAPTTVNGDAGDDAVTIGGGNLNNNLLANVTVNGNGGNDQLHVRDQDTTSGRTHAFATLTQYQFGTTGRTINFNAVESASLQCGSGNDTVEVLLSNIPITLHTGGEFSPPITFPQGDTLRTGVFGPATVILGQTDTVLNLSVGQGVLRIPSGVVLNRVTPAFDLGVNIAGTIDLGGALLFRAGSVTPDIRTLLTRGYNGGAWNGTNAGGAINSSVASASGQSDGVGYGFGSEIAVSSIGGFPIAPGDTLLRYALNGDADLNGVTNISDFARLAANFNGTNKVWTAGDSNYDGTTSINDFASLGANFNQSVSTNLPRTPLAASRFSTQLIGEIL